METIVERAVGLDVHKAQMTACVRVPDRGRQRVQEVDSGPQALQGPIGLPST